MRTLAWRGCAGCNGTLLLDEDQAALAEAQDRAGIYLLCAGCQKRADAEEAARPVAVGSRCVHWSYQSGPFAELYITEVSGDQITVGVLGMAGTDEKQLSIILGQWWPPAMGGKRTFHRSELRMRS